MRYSLFICGLVLAFTGKILCSQEKEQAGPKPVQWPEVLWGTIVDKQNKPIPDARVKLELQKIHELDSGRWDEVLHTDTVITNAKGRFEVDAAEFPELAHRPFCIMLYISADGFSEGKSWAWYGSQDSEISPKLWQSKLVPGQLVVGRCVDPDGNPIEGAIVKADSGYFRAKTRVHVGWERKRSSKSGFFALAVPSDGKHKINLWVAHPEWTAQFVDLNLNEDRQLKVQLRRGGVLQGQVLSREGTPLAGVVVAARSHNDGNIPVLSYPMSIATKTNEDGYYKLPPLDGKYMISLRQAAVSNFDQETGYAVADQPPPVVVPQLVDLQPGEDQILDFQEPALVKVRGSVRWPDDRPAAGADVKIIYMPTEFSVGIELGQLSTNQDGVYETSVPKGIPELLINVSQVKKQEGKWHYAHPQPHVLAKRLETSYLSLNAINEDTDGVDWVLKETYESSTK